MTGNEAISVIIFDETSINLTVKQHGEHCKLKLSEEMIFLTGHPFTLAGRRFSGVTGDVLLLIFTHLCSYLDLNRIK